MKLPQGKKGNKVEEGSASVDIVCYGSKTFYPDSLDNQKVMKKFITATEANIRKSPELKAYIQYLKDELSLNHCLFFKNMDITDVSIELHHYPFSLYDIVEIVIHNFIRTGQPLTTFSVAYQVIKLHYEALIGLVPLTKTVHDLAHAGKVYIPLHAVYGEISTFVSFYQEDISQELLSRLKDIMTFTPEKIETLNSILEERVIYNAIPDKSFLSLISGEEIEDDEPQEELQEPF